MTHARPLLAAALCALLSATAAQAAEPVTKQQVVRASKEHPRAAIAAGKFQDSQYKDAYQRLKGDVKDHPDAARKVYRAGEDNPAATTELYQDARKYPNAAKEAYHVATEHPGKTADLYRRAENHPDAAKEIHRAIDDNPGKVREQYRDASPADKRGAWEHPLKTKNRLVKSYGND